MNRRACPRPLSSRPRGQRGVTTLLVLVVLASLILGGTVGAWMRVVSTRTSGQSVSTARAVACAEAGLAAARTALFTGALPAGTAVTAGVGAVGLNRWQNILNSTWMGSYNRPFLTGQIGPPASFVAQPINWIAPAADFKPLLRDPAPAPAQAPLPLTFTATLANNPTEYPSWGGAAAGASPTQDRDGLFIVTATCNDPTVPYPIIAQRYLRHPDSKSPGPVGGGSAAP